MHEIGTHQCVDRIVSVFQPHVCPIVRGKSKAKIGVADLKTHVKAYLERFGYLPTTCYADKIYMNRGKQGLLKGLHIRTAGKPPGRPSKEMKTDKYKLQSIRHMKKRMRQNPPSGLEKGFTMRITCGSSFPTRQTHGRKHVSLPRTK